MWDCANLDFNQRPRLSFSKMSSGDESKHSKVHVSTGLIRAISHLKTHKATRGRGGKRRWRGRQWRRGRRTYIEISCTVKTILIGHHTERETDNTGERGEERQRVEKGAVVGRQNKQNKTKGKKMVWCATMWAVQKTTNKSDDWGGKDGKTVPNRLWEREERKKGEIITHRATCRTKIPPLCMQMPQSDTTVSLAAY